MKELVSVIIPTFDREKSIVRAVQSVLEQTYKNIEVIIVDDCSKDNTKNIILSEYSNCPLVTYFCLEKNSGACVARNKGIELSHGVYIAFLDSDDVFTPDKIEKQINLLKKERSQLCATNFKRYDKNDNCEIGITYPGTRDEIINKLLYCNFITTGTLMGYRECFKNIKFDETLPRYQDWDIVIRLCKEYDISFLQEPTLIQYHQDISITAGTNHYKTLLALNTIYSKNRIEYEKNKKANTQIHWLMGVHGLFVKGENPYRNLWYGVFGNGINVKRLFVVCFAFCGCKKYINKFF